MSTQGTPWQNISWLMIERIVRLLITAVVTGLIARYLEPAGFGVLNFTVTLTMLLVPIASISLDGVVIHELVRHPERRNVLLGTALMLRLAGGVACAVGLTSAALLVPAWRIGFPLLLPLSLVLIWQAFEVPDLWFRQQLLARWSASARLLALLAIAALKIALVLRGASLRDFAWIYSLESLLYGAALFLNYRRAHQNFSSWRFCTVTAKTILLRSMGLALAGLLSTIAFRLDQLMVYVWLGNTASGVYFAATRLTELPVFLATSVAASLFPVLAASHAMGSDAFMKKLGEAFDLLTLIGFGIAAAITVAAPWLVPLLYGAAYHDAVPILIIQTWATLLIFSGTVRVHFAVLTDAGWTQMLIAAIMLIAQLSSGAWLIPRMGLLGAAFSQALAMLISGWATSFVFPAMRPSAGPQSRAFLILFRPQSWLAAIRLLI